MKYILKPQYPSEVEAWKLDQTVVLENGTFKRGDYILNIDGKIQGMEKKEFEAKYTQKVTYTPREYEPYRLPRPKPWERERGPVWQSLSGENSYILRPELEEVK